jgi:hypothetical protein
MSDALRRLMAGELSERAAAELEQLRLELYGSGRREESRVLRAILACRGGARLEDVAKTLDWKEFESFCADLLRTRGFTVEENLMITNPRAQIDMLARSELVALAVDCKHWKRSTGGSAISRCVSSQRRRARLLRAKSRDLEPIASVILLLAEEELRFVGGAAVVPVRTLGSFLDGIASYSDLLEYD